MSDPVQIGPYRVLRAIASGGMARVYEVQDPASEERYALKLLSASEALQRFNREYEAMTRLNHPNIVRVYQYGLHAGQPWLTMELLSGTPALQHLKDFPSSSPAQRLREALRIGYFLSLALHYIHERGLVHRDLKSANVLVLPDDRVKLIDFGTAHLEDPLERITAEGEFVGTWAYASPEQITGNPVDHRSDLYSFGVLMYRLLTGRRPFPGNEPEELAHQHASVQPPDPRLYAPFLPHELAELLLTLLHKHPDDRPADAGQVARVLEKVAGQPFAMRSPLAIHVPDAIPRLDERGQILARLAAHTPGQLQVITGDEGSDRERLAVRCSAIVEASDVVVATCRLEEASGPVPVLAALGALRAQHGDADAGFPMQHLQDADRWPVLTELAMAWVRRTERPSLLLVLDAHRASIRAASLLEDLQRAALQGERPFQILAVAPQAALGDPTEIARWLHTGEIVHLPPLTPRAVAVAVGVMLGRRPPTGDLAWRLYTASGGQPLFLEEAVADLMATGGIEADGNRLSWSDGSLDVGMSAAALQSSEAAYLALPIAWRLPLYALAFIGPDADLASVSAAIGWEVDEVDRVLKSLVSGGVLTAQLQWRVAGMEALVNERVPAARRRAMARCLLQLLERRGPSRPLVSAYLALDRVDDAIRCAVDVAQRLAPTRRLRDVLTFLEPVMARAGEGRPGVALAELHLMYGQVICGVRPADPGAARSLALARRLAGDKHPALRARTELTTARWQAVIGHYRNYSRFLHDAWQSMEGVRDATLRATIALEIGHCYMLQGDVGQSEAWYVRAQGISFDDNNLALSGASLAGYASCQYTRALVDAGEATAHSALASCERAEDRPGVWSALATWANCLRHQGRYSEALGALYRRIPEASQWPDPGPYVALLLTTAWCELDLARLGRAQECVDELNALLSQGEYLHQRLEAGLVSGRILLASGQHQEAAFLLADVERRARQAELLVLADRARSAHGRTVAELGDLDAARSELQSALLGLQAAGDLLAVAETCVDQSLGLPMDAPATLWQPFQRLEKRPLPAFQLERMLGEAHWSILRGERDVGVQRARDAAALLNRVAARLNDTDRAALRVHPWTRRIRAALAGRIG